MRQIPYSLHTYKKNWRRSLLIALQILSHVNEKLIGHKGFNSSFALYIFGWSYLYKLRLTQWAVGCHGYTWLFLVIYKNSFLAMQDRSMDSDTTDHNVLNRSKKPLVVTPEPNNTGNHASSQMFLTLKATLSHQQRLCSPQASVAMHLKSASISQGFLRR
jgi:hypothetical protein